MNRIIFKNPKSHHHYRLATKKDREPYSLPFKDSFIQFVL